MATLYYCISFSLWITFLLFCLRAPPASSCRMVFSGAASALWNNPSQRSGCAFRDILFKWLCDLVGHSCSAPKWYSSQCRNKQKLLLLRKCYLMISQSPYNFLVTRPTSSTLFTRPFLAKRHCGLVMRLGLIVHIKTPVIHAQHHGIWFRVETLNVK